MNTPKPTHVTLLDGTVVPVTTFAEASRLVLEEIALEGLGASDWYGRGAGRVLADGKDVAHVSYNGRVWAGRARKDNDAVEIQIGGA